MTDDRELDARLAEQAGWRQVRSFGDNEDWIGLSPNGWRGPVPHYTNIVRMCRVGSLRDPQPDDPSFDGDLEAIAAACEKSTAESSGVVAVWEAEHGQIVALCYEGIPYLP